MNSLLSFLLILASTIGYSQTYTEIFKAAGFDRESEDRMGYSVAISGDYAIIGAYGDDFGAFDPNMGSAYIFEKTGLENWAFVQKINNSDQDDYDRFGWSVAIEGNIAVIGAYSEDEDEMDSNTLAKAGSIYVFERGVDGLWVETQKLVASDRQAGDEFGWSVDVSDSTIIVGAHFEEHDVMGMNYEYHAGSVYIFDKDISGVWSQTQKIVPSHRSDDHYHPEGRVDPTDEDLSDLFGGSVAIWGDYLIAGSHNHDYGAGGVGTGLIWNSGAAYIFERAGGVWTEVEKIQCTIRTPWDRFGYAVDIDSNIVVVGAYAEDESEFEGASLMNAGGAYIFERDGAGAWLQIQKLDASDRTTGDHFGRDVAIDDNFLVIGAEQEDLDELSSETMSNAGAAYIFEKDGGGTWSEIQKIVPSDRDITDLFGESVSISNHTIFVGAWQQDLDSIGGDYSEDAGAGYFFSSVICVEAFYTYGIEICAGDSIIVGENVYSVTGEYIDTLLNIDACDSIVTTNLIVIEPLITAQEITICSGTSFMVSDSIYSESGIYVNTLVALSGCDSIVTTTLIIEPAVTFSQDLYLCYGFTYEIGGSIYDTTGIYIDSLTTDAGCDSVVTTSLFIEAENTTSQSFIICAYESIMVGGTEYNISGDFIDTLVSATFCDSIVYTTLDVLPVINTTIVSMDVITLRAGDPDIVSTSFQWYSCDPFEIIPGATEQIYTAIENGVYAAVITDLDCQDTTDCFAIFGVGIENNSSPYITVYPNPSNGQLTIESSNFKGNTFTVSIRNNIGAVVYEAIIEENKTLLNLNYLAKGIYILQLSDGEKMVIEKINIQ